jgi:hypothetical protein
VPTGSCFLLGLGLISFLEVRSCSGFALFIEACWPGVARRQVTFFCFAKRKSPKKRRPAVWVPTLRFGQPAVLEASGVWHKLASLRHARSLIRLPLRSSAQPGRGNREPNTKYKELIQIPTRTRHGESLLLQVFGIGIRLFGIPSPHPFWMRRGAQGQTDQGSRVFERSEFARDPGWTEHRRLPGAKRRDAASRVAFLLLTLLLAKQRKVSRCRATPASHPQQRARRRSKTLHLSRTFVTESIQKLPPPPMHIMLTNVL